MHVKIFDPALKILVFQGGDQVSGTQPSLTTVRMHLNFSLPNIARRRIWSKLPSVLFPDVIAIKIQHDHQKRKLTLSDFFLRALKQVRSLNFFGAAHQQIGSI